MLYSERVHCWNTSLRSSLSSSPTFNKVIRNFNFLWVSLGSSINRINTNMFLVPSLSHCWKYEIPTDLGPTQQISLPHVITFPSWTHLHFIALPCSDIALLVPEALDICFFNINFMFFLISLSSFLQRIRLDTREHSPLDGSDCLTMLIFSSFKALCKPL